MVVAMDSRSGSLNYHDFSNSLKFFNGRPDEKFPEIDSVRGATRHRKDYFAAEAAKCGVDVTAKWWKPTADFEMVTVAAKMMPAWSNGWKPEVEIPSQWRMLSGYAHGMRWAAAPDTKQGDADANGFASTTLAFDLDRLMESAGLVRMLIETAIDRYRLLAGHPQSVIEELTRGEDPPTDRGTDTSPSSGTGNPAEEPCLLGRGGARPTTDLH